MCLVWDFSCCRIFLKFRRKIRFIQCMCEWQVRTSGVLFVLCLGLG